MAMMLNFNRIKGRGKKKVWDEYIPLVTHPNPIAFMNVLGNAFKVPK